MFDLWLCTDFSRRGVVEVLRYFNPTLVNSRVASIFFPTPAFPMSSAQPKSQLGAVRNSIV